MELWNRHISSVTHSLRGTRYFLGAFLTCCILCPLTVESEAGGSSQRKFVWTTAWPMEENYVTYKLIGPLIDKGQTNLVSLPSSSTNQRNVPPQQNFFLYLSTPKDRLVSGIPYIEEEKKATSVTEAGKFFEKVGLKTETELDEEPAHQNIVSLVNPGYFGRTSNSAVKQRGNVIPLLHKAVFSERKHGSFVPSKFTKSKKHASELRSDQSDPLTGLTNHFPRDNLSKLIDEVNSNACNLPDFICKEGKNYCMSTAGLKKSPNSLELSDQTGKAQAFRILPHRSVAKKARTNNFLSKKPKTSETFQFSKLAKITSAEGENAFSKIHPVTKGNKPKFSAFNETPSNILKVVKITTDNHYRSLNDSANVKDFQSPYFKICGRTPHNRSENASLPLSKYPSAAHNLLRGRVMSSYYDMSKVRSNKDFKTDPKSERFEKTIDVNTKSSVKFAKSGSISKVASKKEKLPPSMGYKGSAKKRRENPDQKEFSKEKNTPRIIQTRVKKLPPRYKSRSIKRMRGPTMAIGNYNN